VVTVAVRTPSPFNKRRINRTFASSGGVGTALEINRMRMSEAIDFVRPSKRFWEAGGALLGRFAVPSGGMFGFIA
jgi:hypothetical protein